MKLSICVPHYKEQFKDCRKLFDSIALQKGIDLSDIEVIIVNDGAENAWVKKDIPRYLFGISVLTQSHKGVSAARNLAMDNAFGDYIMFCDCDDMLINSYGLYLVFSVLKEKEYDLITSAFVEEQISGDKYGIFRHDKDMTFLHGKVFRKDFLTGHKIRFCEDLTIHEDGYFTSLCAVEQESTRHIENPFYLWCWNSSSVVRHNPSLFLMRTYPNLIDARTQITREFYSRGYISEYYDAVCKTLIDAYYEFNKPDYLNKDNKAIAAVAAKAVKAYYNAFKDAYKESNINRIAEIMQLCRMNAYSSGMRIEQLTLNDWIIWLSEQ